MAETKFYEETHQYFCDGEEFASVTTYIKRFTNGFNPNEIINQFYNKWQRDPTSDYCGKTPDQIKKEWIDNGKKSSDFGIKVHKEIEHFIRYGTPAETPEFEQYIEWVSNQDNIEIVETEFKVFDDDLKLAGTMDLLAMINEKLYIIDHKTSQNKKLYPDKKYKSMLYPFKNYWDEEFSTYTLQLALYKDILERKYGYNISGCYLLHLNSCNESYNLIETPINTKDIEKLKQFRLSEIQSQN